MESVADALPGISVHLRREVDGPVLCEEALVARDLAEAMAEVAFEAGMRRVGMPLSLSDVEARVIPVHHRGPEPKNGHRGFELEVESSEGSIAQRFFDREIFEPVAVRASRRLVKEGKLSKGDLFYYSLEIEETTVGPLPMEGQATPPTVDCLPIDPFLGASNLVSADADRTLADEAYALERDARSADEAVNRARSLRVEASDDEDHHADASSLHYPVFYTPTALARAERVSRKGASQSPPVESGGLLLGRLYWCADTRQLFGVVDDVLEATGSEGTTYSLTFTGETWARVQAVLRARQRNPMTRGERILGQCHGHNFLPFSEGATCDGCPAQSACSLTTAYLSTSDRVWCRAVFPREPWQLSHVFGLTPRRESVSAMYGQWGGELVRREYRVLEDDFGEP
jgi:hypothetical protein